jgi:hypothetical protein
MTVEIPKEEDVGEAITVADVLLAFEMNLLLDIVKGGAVAVRGRQPSLRAPPQRVRGERGLRARWLWPVRG